jgi:hypothetical protein
MASGAGRLSERDGQSRRRVAVTLISATDSNIATTSMIAA